MDRDSRVRRRFLFAASCVALAATAMTFGIRADIMDSLAAQFHLTNEQIGWIAGTAFWGFTVSMLIGGQICDLLGMKRLIQLAFIAHLTGIGLTIAATGFAMLYMGTLSIGLANGFVEAALNPLVPTLYPNSKTERLNRLHVWFPGGIVMGGLCSALLTQIGSGWRIKMLILVAPTLAYGSLFFPARLPRSERAQNNIPARVMYAQALRPGFLILLFSILLTAATELGPNQWIPSILTKTTALSGMMVLVWITSLEAIGRRFAGAIVSVIPPTGLLCFSAALSAVGLWALGTAQAKLPVIAAATIYALGICFCWPTMYGITAERFPAGGPFLLAVIGSAGMLSDALMVPLMGRIYDIYGPGVALRYAAILPCIVTAIFAGIWLHDRAHGGYRIVHLAEAELSKGGETTL
ncbi:MAG: MFS transporter [Bryobacteraceae bacterium]